MIKIERVLVPVDGSDSSRNAAKYASYLLNERNPVLYLMYVIEPIHMTIGGDEASELREEERQKAIALLEEYKQMLDNCNMRIELIVREGQPSYRILDVQEEFDCDMIVIGSRGLSALEGVVMGSVVTKVLQGAKCPVLVTRNLRHKYLQGACGI